MKVPEGVKVEIAGDAIKVTGKRGTLEKKFNVRFVKATQEGGEVNFELIQKHGRKNEAVLNTLESHLKNMAAGVTEGYEKKLQVVYAHFPISVEVKGDEVSIKNFFGEKTPRKAEIKKGAKVEVKGQEIIVSGSDKEAVGQTAANIVNATKITNRDERVFQDGAYYT